MIPHYPTFKSLELIDKAEIDAFVRQFPSYSQFSFASLYAYDYSEDSQLSWLDGNLVLRLQDFTTMGHFYSFLGTNRVAKTIETLLVRAHDEGIQAELQIVPEVCVRSEIAALRQRFMVEEEEACFDYVLDALELSRMSASGTSTHTRDILRFTQRHPEVALDEVDLRRKDVQRRIRDLFEVWAEAKQKSTDEVDVERKALARTLAIAEWLDMISVCAFLGNELVGFTMNEVVPDGYYVGHFGKADPQYRGLGAFLEQETAKRMIARGCRWMNYEEDLGSPGLRAYKQSFNPVTFLKKFTIGQLALEAPAG